MKTVAGSSLASQAAPAPSDVIPEALLMKAASPRLSSGFFSVKFLVLSLIMAVLSLLSGPLQWLPKSIAAPIAVALALLSRRVASASQEAASEAELPADYDLADAEHVVLEAADGVHVRVVVQGAPQTGKTTLLGLLRARCPPTLRVLPASEAPPSAEMRDVCVLVWHALYHEDMKTYATGWRKQLTRGRKGRPLPVVLVCNKSDVAPCPLPQINAMTGTDIPCLAVSATKGTNLQCARATRTGPDKRAPWHPVPSHECMPRAGCCGAYSGTSASSRGAWAR